MHRSNKYTLKTGYSDFSEPRLVYFVGRPSIPLNVRASAFQPLSVLQIWVNEHIYMYMYIYIYEYVHR